jgi:hypothetical protein
LGKMILTTVTNWFKRPEFDFNVKADGFIYNYSAGLKITCE